jgi:uncharacterized protein YchJ
MSEKPGRNEPCHCGSGSKYKKCCLEKDDEAARVAAANARSAAAAATAEAPDQPVRTERPAQQQAPKPVASQRNVPSSARRRSV